jgi:hypothetical protein
MKSVAAMLVVFLCAAAAQAADTTQVDLDRQRMLTTEAAIRAGANRPAPPVMARKSAAAPAAATQRPADGFFPLHREAAGREFPLPPRGDTAAPTGVQALVKNTNPTATPAATPSSTTMPQLDPQQAAGMNAILAHRRDPGFRP